MSVRKRHSAQVRQSVDKLKKQLHIRLSFLFAKGAITINTQASFDDSYFFLPLISAGTDARYVRDALIYKTD